MIEHCLTLIVDIMKATNMPIKQSPARGGFLNVNSIQTGSRENRLRPSECAWLDMKYYDPVHPEENTLSPLNNSSFLQPLPCYQRLSKKSLF